MKTLVPSWVSVTLFGLLKHSGTDPACRGCRNLGHVQSHAWIWNDHLGISVRVCRRIRVVRWQQDLEKAVWRVTSGICRQNSSWDALDILEWMVGEALETDCELEGWGQNTIECKLQLKKKFKEGWGYFSEDWKGCIDVRMSRVGRTRNLNLKLFQKGFRNVALERELSSTSGKCSELLAGPVGCNSKVFIEIEHFFPSPSWPLPTPSLWPPLGLSCTPGSV